MESTAKLHVFEFSQSRTYMIAALFVAGNIVLPQLCHLMPQGGLVWLPIYFFTLLAAYKYGWKVGLLTALASPLANSMLFGMPAAAMLPAIMLKSVLLAVFAAFAANRAGKASLAAVVIVSILTINNVEYVDENGDASTGIAAAGNLRKAKNQWAGYLTDEVFAEVIKENNTVNASKEALSDDYHEQDKAYAKKQGYKYITG